MSRVSISQFHSGLGWDKHRKVWHAIFDCNIRSYIFMKQHSTDCIKFWRRVDHQSILKHMEVNIQKIFIMFWMEEFQEMIHFIIINWFNWSAVWIWNLLIVKFNWKVWSVIFNIIIISGMMIKSPHDSWNHRDSVRRRGHGFELSFWRLADPLSWWFIWFINMKGVELIHLSSKTWWEEFWTTYDASIRLVSN